MCSNHLTQPMKQGQVLATSNENTAKPRTSTTTTEVIERYTTLSLACRQVGANHPDVLQSGHVGLFGKSFVHTCVWLMTEVWFASYIGSSFWRVGIHFVCPFGIKVFVPFLTRSGDSRFWSWGSTEFMSIRRLGWPHVGIAVNGRRLSGCDGFAFTIRRMLLFPWMTISPV